MSTRTAKKTRSRRDPESHVPTGGPNPRTLAQFRREVVALLRASHRLSGPEGTLLVVRGNAFVVAAWRNGRAPCFVADHLASKSPRHRVGRDYQNPVEGEVYQSRAGTQWRITSVNAVRRRVKVKRSGFRDLGELEWNPIVLKEMHHVQNAVAEQIRHDEGPLEPYRPPSAAQSQSAPTASGLRGWFGGLVAPDPRGRPRASKSRASRGGKSERRYHVYVIETVQGDSRVLYVGQSAHTPAQRLLQHKQGVAYCDGCTKRSYAKGTKMRLVPEFYKRIPVIRTRQQAEKVERILARKLRSLGFTVEGGH